MHSCFEEWKEIPGAPHLNQHFLDFGRFSNLPIFSSITFMGSMTALAVYPSLPSFIVTTMVHCSSSAAPATGFSVTGLGGRGLRFYEVPWRPD
jgi:hypothetical protein